MIAEEIFLVAFCLPALFRTFLAKFFFAYYLIGAVLAGPYFSRHRHPSFTG
jgi:hypothetical protein